MRISTVRQLSRTLGTILAEITQDSSEARSFLEEIQGYKPKVDVYSTLLTMTVGAIFEAPNFNSSTRSVVKAWRDLAREQNLKRHFYSLASSLSQGTQAPRCYKTSFQNQQ